MDLETGQVYKRTELHDHFGGQQQGGISTPSQHSVILLFTGKSGEHYGYRDGFQEDGTFWYTGEGQAGDMGFVRGNKALLEANENGRTIHLFEYVQTADVKYLGELSYVGHHYALAPDANGQVRRVIVFEFAVGGEQETNSPIDEIQGHFTPSKLWSMPISKVRATAMSGLPPRATPQQRRSNSYIRSEAVKVYVLRRADGTCEGCGKAAPFKNPRGRPYLEPHHIHRLADGGPDLPAHVAALCPNCHRRVHYGLDGEVYNKDIADRIRVRENSLS